VDEDSAVDATTWYADADGDGFGSAATGASSCIQPSGYIADGSDCDDSDSAVYPAAYEYCNGYDDDCDGGVDEDDAVDASEWYADSDMDGYGDLSVAASSCSAPSGYVADATDCDDTDASIHPAATEVCEDGVDNNCDDEGCELRGSISLATADVTLTGSDHHDYGGAGGAFVGDVNADGWDDFAVGAQAYPAGAFDGGVFLALGPVTASADMDSLDSVFQGEDGAGEAIAGAGDVNGDGFDDLLFGAEGYGYSTGAAYLVYGPASSSYVLSSADARIYATTTLTRLGTAVGTAGDQNGDGYDDILIGAPGKYISPTYSGGYAAEAGAVYLFHGPVSGVMDETYANAALEGVNSAGGAGTSVAGDGDFNGDGFADVALGTPNYESTGRSRDGGIFVFYGPVSGTSSIATADAIIDGVGRYAGVGYSLDVLGDVNGDSHDDIVFSYGSGAYVFFGPLSGALEAPYADATFSTSCSGSGNGELGAAGDVDQDGLEDLVVGDRCDSTSGSSAGAAYVYYGPFTGSHGASDADAILLGISSGDAAGYTVGGGGDADGDGYPDVFVGARGVATNGEGCGATYLLFSSGL